MSRNDETFQMAEAAADADRADAMRELRGQHDDAAEEAEAEVANAWEGAAATELIGLLFNDCTCNFSDDFCPLHGAA